MRIGVDLGGTKIEIAAIDDAMRTLLRRRIPTPAGDYAATVEAIAQLVEDAERELSRRGSVGVGTPGSVSRRTGLMQNANSTVLIGKPLQRDLETRLRRSVRLANDANCLALSEAVDGAAAGARVVFAVILGTGVGGGIAIDGRVWDGTNGIAGEWGHNPLPWPRSDELPGPPCYCGKRGCIETFLSGPALERERQTNRNDAEARYADRLARSLATAIDLLDPDAIVFGGGVSNVAGLTERTAAILPRYVFSDSVNTPLLRAAHGDSSGVRGAAMLWTAPLPGG